MTACCFCLTAASCWKAIPDPVATAAAPWPVWAGLGVNAGKKQLQCGYIVNAGSGTGAGGAGFPSNAIGQGLLGSTALGQVWWYAVAICDNDGTTGTNATFATAFDTAVVSAQNEHK